MAKIYPLTICHTCHNIIKKNEGFTVWEGSNYCEPCYDEYLDLIEPGDFSNIEVTTISPVVEYGEMN